MKIKENPVTGEIEKMPTGIAGMKKPLREIPSAMNNGKAVQTATNFQQIKIIIKVNKYEYFNQLCFSSLYCG